MKRVAALYDIHGNLPALEAVLEDLATLDLDLILVGGDIVPGPMPSQCLSLLRSLSVPVHFILGNGEADILTLFRREPLTRVPVQYHPMMNWVAKDLSPEHIHAFACWPANWRGEIEELGKVLFCHATPRDDNEIFTRITPESRLRPIFEAARADLVVCGHTHMQFDRKIGNLRVVNAGSVGMPFGKPEAFWLLLDGAVQFRSTRYDLEAAAGRITSTKYPGVEQFDVRHPPAESEMLKVFEAAAGS